MEKKYFTYMVRCQDGTLYTGFTVDDPEKRVAVHNAGKGAKYTKGRLPVPHKADRQPAFCGTGNGTTVMMPGPVNSI